MSESAAREEATLLTSVIAMAQQAGSQPGVEVLMSYAEPPSKERLESDHPEGSDGLRGVHALLMLGETVGAYVKHGALSVELVNDVLWLSGMWDRAERYVKDIRAQYGEDTLYENFELAARQG